MMRINPNRCILRNSYFAKSYAMVPTQNPDSLFDTANSLHTQGRLDIATVLYRKITRFAPDFHKAAYNLAIIYHEQGDFKSAKTYLQRFVKKENLDVNVRSLFAKSLAKIHQECGNFSQAIKNYHIALQGLPEDKDIIDNLGNSYASSGNLEEALVWFKKAVDLDPSDLKAKLKLAHTLQDFKKNKEAMVIFGDILKYSPNDVEAMLGMGVSLTYLISEEEQGNKEALAKIVDSIQKYFNSAYLLEPQNPHVLLNFGIFLIEQGINKTLGAQYLNQAIQLAPNDVDLLYSVGFLKFKQGHNTEALNIFEKLLAADPKHTETLVHIGLIHQENGDVNKALNYYRLAVENEPKNAQNRNLYGMVLQETGKLAEALEQFTIALKENKKDWSTHMNLATIYRQMKEISKSDQHRAICIKLNKESIKMFEVADAENSETDASVDSLEWARHKPQYSLIKNADNQDQKDGEEEEEEYEVSSSDDSTDSSSDTSDSPSSDNESINRE